MDAAPRAAVHSTWRDSARFPLALVVVCVALACGVGRAGAQSRLLGRPGAALGEATARGSAATSAAASPPASASASASASDVDRARELAAPDRLPPRREPFPIGLDVGVATHVPITVGLEANLELPLGLLLRGHVGLMPSPYLGIINGVASGFGAYDQSVASLVDRTGGDALVLRFSGGIRPAPGYGFEVLAGYTMIHASTRVPVEDFEQATGQSMPGMDSVGISATLHAFHVEMGWSALVWDHLVIRGSIGWVHTLAAEGSIDVPAAIRARAAGRIEAVETDVREALTSYGFSPEARIGVAYRF